MKNSNELELNQVENKLFGGFQKLSDTKMAKIKGGIADNRICVNAGTCPSINRQECKNESGGCQEARNENICVKY